MEPEDWFSFVFFYVVCGFLTSAVMIVSGVMPDIGEAPATFIAVMATWPLFLIKYLAIGLWLVVSSGFNLLIGA